MIQIDLKSRKPIYEQVIDKFKELIIKEVLKEDDKIPSVRELSKMLTINPNTIQKAYKELERQNYIYTLRGRGNFVSSKKESVDEEKIMELKKKMKKIISELIYMGITKEDLIKLINKVYDDVKGGREIDKSIQSE
ncbi:MAG: GntR family transcriptional regulator [Peptostreptococcaceae bacterium]|nr:GntR family transcriptional regulator [Peptostreptococcaceae bacterium]